MGGTPLGHRMHERLYTFAQEDTPVEIVTVRVDAQGAFPPPRVQEVPLGADSGAALVDRHPMYLEGCTVECPVYDRSRLGGGARIVGPALVVELDSTALVAPGRVAEVDAFGNLLIRAGE